MLDELKQAVCQANLDLVSHGLVILTWGNVSGLSEDRELMAIKPSGVAYPQLRPEHIVIVSIATGEVVEGDLKPSSDTPTHRLLYQSFAGIGGITHTHSVNATSWAQARRAIPCFGTTHADHFYGELPVTRPLTQQEIEEAYEVNTGHVIVETFAQLDPSAVPGVLVANHAPFSWGKDAAKSVENAVAIEAVAEMAWKTLAINPNAPAVDQFLLDKHYFRKHGAGAYYGQSGDDH
ncbi:L-ribulose-5-phosphate 4-epimerase [Aeoliella sp. ICT_H6.2]|uniref:L-ribulose-5-phosphate 4-epimerase n=1 Tax=Aeoliella straminimaris TaxID=2954799 RepID=A0A9X2JEM6_9BACT|nr:L-ribulose-5-phosphate 4-epimerase [Aeoliella straminimaris]MCO6042821.1 L-ribulose-5-phosphate 4-epimerase [Aeoliella straminimaris]